MKTLTKVIFATAFVLCMALFMRAQTSMDYNIFIEDIEFQPGVTIDIDVNAYVNENATNWANHGKIFAIEGMAHTANCLKPLAEEFFLNPPQTEINEFFAIDMPGRGGSGVPEGLNSMGQPFLLDQMYIEDYLVVIQGAIEYLIQELGIQPNTIMGHSLGGLEVIMLQNKLIDEGTNLRKAYGFKNAVLLAPAPPAPIDWGFISGTGGSALLSYVAYIPGLGTMLDLVSPPNCYAWPYIFFTNTCCYFPPYMVPGAPTPAEVITNGYNAMEPGPLCLQIAGMEIPPGLPYPYKPRVEANPNIFKSKHGVQLTIISDEFDKMMTPGEELELYEFLTGDFKHKRLFEVLGDETCHDTHISDPHAIVELLDSPSIFKSSETEQGLEVNCNVAIYPNPVKDNAVISYENIQDGIVSIRLFNSCGTEVTGLLNEFQNAGHQKISFNIQKLPAGVYFVNVTTGKETKTRKIIKID